MDCGTLPNLEHGTVTLKDQRTSHGARAVYTCHENYTLIGHEVRTCGDDSKWTNSTPQCLFDWCPDPPDIHGGVVHTSGHRAGDTATYSCQAGYVIAGEGVSLFFELTNSEKRQREFCRFCLVVLEESGPAKPPLASMLIVGLRPILTTAGTSFATVPLLWRVSWSIIVRRITGWMVKRFKSVPKKENGLAMHHFVNVSKSLCYLCIISTYSMQ